MLPILLMFSITIISLSVLNHVNVDFNNYIYHFCPNAIDGDNDLQLLARLISYLELVRTIVRPFSLSLRLCANISCRHILMVLGNASFCLSRISIIVLCLLETLVCVVQAYVFYTLLSMYLDE